MSLVLLALLAAIVRGEVESVDVISCRTFAAPVEKTGNHPKFTVCETKLKSEPEWNGPGSSPAPLSTDQAVSIARKEIGRYSRVNDWQLAEVSIGRVSVGSVEKWMYFIKWRATMLHDLVLEIPVLMSGHPVDGEGQFRLCRPRPKEGNPHTGLRGEVAN